MEIIEYYTEVFGVDHKLLEIADALEESLSERFKVIEEIRDINQLKVISAMQKHRLTEMHFNPSTGYGYGDAGRETLDKIFADVFNAESAFVRQQIANGTHAISLSLFSCLRPGDTIMSITGKPYDTIEEAIGIRNSADNGSLKDFGVRYKQIDMITVPEDRIDFESAIKAIDSSVKAVFIQKSRGYSSRKALSNAEIGEAISRIKAVKPDIIAIVDNCYGEFVETDEPVSRGADLIAGSLIKNPGGGLAPSGGYIAGRADLVEKAAHRFISPGVGLEVGSNPMGSRLLFQGLFMAPHIVAESLKGAVFCAAMADRLGFKASPDCFESRYDLIQSIHFNEPDNIIEFCRGIQKAAIVDSHITPEPWPMPGYDCDVIMASGGFIQGSTMELSADAPIRPPYIAYMQGGLIYQHVKLGVLIAFSSMLKKGRVKLGL